MDVTSEASLQVTMEQARRRYSRLNAAAISARREWMSLEEDAADAFQEFLAAQSAVRAERAAWAEEHGRGC